MGYEQEKKKKKRKRGKNKKKNNCMNRFKKEGKLKEIDNKG